MPASLRTKTKRLRRNGGLEGYAKRITEAAKRKRAAVKVGLPRGSGAYPDGTSVITVGIVNEFGAPGAGIPMRSFLRSAIAENDAEIRKGLRRVARAAQDGAIQERQALALLGQMAASLVQAKIVDGPFEPNAPSTISRKGSSSPLIDTGLLRASITYEVVE